MGFADTNSTLTRRARTGRTRPQPAGSARIASIVRSRTESASLMLRKPGGATSIDASSGSAEPRSAAATAPAISSGDRRKGRASFIATLVAMSPCSWFAGRSTSTVGVAPSGEGRSPAAMATASARSTARRTSVRTGGAACVDGRARGASVNLMDPYGVGAFGRTCRSGPRMVPDGSGTRTVVLACTGIGSLCRCHGVQNAGIGASCA